MFTKSILKATALTAALALAGTSFNALAQDDDDDDGGDGTVRLENATIIEVVHIAFKPGKRTRAMEIITDYFIAASDAAGTAGPLYNIHYDTGKYDITIAWVLEGGFDDLMWYVSPDDLKWFAALAEQVGGEEEANAIWGEYIGLVAHAHSEVGHIHNPDDGDDE